MNEWVKLSELLKNNGTEFIIEPTIRFKGKPGEQATLFFKDPEGNALEFKAFKDLGQLFAT
jgi:extradiol dioxygenase family protein